MSKRRIGQRKSIRRATKGSSAATSLALQISLHEQKDEGEVEKDMETEALTLKRKPIVYLTLDVKRRLDLYIKLATGEISGLGEVEITDDGNFLVTRLILFEQVCTGASTVLDLDDVARFFTQAISEGVDTQKFKLWWHSHVDFAAFWSGTDTNTMDRLNNGEWLISIVGNRSGERRVRLDIFSPVRGHIDDLPLVVLPEENQELEQEIADEISTKVKYKTGRWAKPSNPFGRVIHRPEDDLTRYSSSAINDFEKFVRVDGMWRLRRQYDQEREEVAAGQQDPGKQVMQDQDDPSDQELSNGLLNQLMNMEKPLLRAKKDEDDKLPEEAEPE